MFLSNKSLRWGLLFLLFAGAFWMIDLPATVRFKVMIVKLLPLEPETTKSAIMQLCAGAYSGMAAGSCSYNFRSEDAEAKIDAKNHAQRQCASLRNEVRQSKEWYYYEGEHPLFIYIGSDEKMKGTNFDPEKCVMFDVFKGKYMEIK